MLDAVATIQGLITSGLNPKKFREGVAQRSGKTLEEIDAIIAAAGEMKAVDIHIAAHNRMLAQRAEAKKNPAAWRAHNHEDY